MINKSLAKDYIERARKRLSALAALHKEESWADVVRESQEVVELALKALLRHHHIEVPRIHDVSGILEAESTLFPPKVQKNLSRYMQISRTLRRDRELAFYGSEDLTPNEFYPGSADFAQQSSFHFQNLRFFTIRAERRSVGGPRTPKVWHHLLSDRRTYDARVDLRAHRSFKAGFGFWGSSKFFGNARGSRRRSLDSNPCPSRLPRISDLGQFDFQGSGTPFGLIVYAEE